MPQCAPHAGTQLPSRDSGTRNVGTRPHRNACPTTSRTGGSFQFPDRFAAAPHDSNTQRSRTGESYEDDRGPGPHKEPRDAGGRRHVRPARRRHPARLRPDHRLVHPPHPGAPRAGRRPHGRGLRHGDRAARRGHRDQRAGRHQHRDAARQRLHGLDAAGRRLGPGGHRLHRHRRLPGVRHHRRHHGHHQAQLAHQGRRRHPEGGRRRLPRRHDRAAGAGPDRPAQGHLERHHGVVLAVVRRRARPAGLPPGDVRRPRAHRPGRRADRPGAPPRLLRRRRRAEGPGRRGAAGAGGADRASRSSPR